MIEDFYYRGLRVSAVSIARLNDYVSLFADTFPKFRASESYLRWLYFENPLGDVVGFDALDGDRVVAHYVCIPTKISSFSQKSLLALNTATHPKYQGRGLLKVLAETTYSSVEDNFACVVGVANSQAIGALTKHLGFRQIANLELRFGKISGGFDGRRVYTESELAWRASSPLRKMHTINLGRGEAGVVVFPFGPIFPILGKVPVINGVGASPSFFRIFFKFGLTLDWNKDIQPRFYLPKFFKPSPLAFVFRPLCENSDERIIAWTFPDFDAL